MASAAEVKTSLKHRLGLSSVTTFDTFIDTEIVPAAVRRLYPRASLEVDSQEIASISVDDFGECTVDLSSISTPVAAARRVEAYDGYTWRQLFETYHHGKYLRLRGLIKSSDTKIRIYGIQAFTAIADVPDQYLQAVYWYGMSEFYDFLAGSKSDYNIYTQNSGARAVDNMRDESVYFEQRADSYIDQQVKD